MDDDATSVAPSPPIIFITTSGDGVIGTFEYNVNWYVEYNVS